MKDWIPLIIFYTIFLTSLIGRILASENLLEEYSDERSNVLLNWVGLNAYIKKLHFARIVFKFTSVETNEFVRFAEAA